jgi:HPt (histidine-containing phosphotransfer) domain-containing protein
MILIVKDSKIEAVDKRLLDLLGASLENISNLVTLLEMEIASINNSKIEIGNKKFKIKKLPLLSIENIEVFDLLTEEISKTTIPSTQKEEFAPKEEKLDFGLNIEPISEMKEEPSFIQPQIQPQEEFKIEPEPIKIEPIQENKEFSFIEPAETTITPKEEPQIQLQETQELKKLKPKEPTLAEPTLEPTEEEGVISLNFEDEFSEIEEMLNQSAEEGKKNLQNELENAARELSIDIDTIYELKDELFDMFIKEKEALQKAIKNKNYDEIHKIAHKLKGAALNLRLSNLAMILKKIDEISKQKKDIHKIEYLTDKFYKYLDKVNTKIKPKIPKEIRNLILKTVEEYLQSQNEKKFQRDKKYIEMLLNVKINSIEDLQNIIKE